MHSLCGKAPSAGVATHIEAGLLEENSQVFPLSIEIKVYVISSKTLVVL